jgi:hypothetical protein
MLYMPDKLHDLTMFYLQQYKPATGSLADLVAEYYRVKQEIRDAVTEYQKQTSDDS